MLRKLKHFPGIFIPVLILLFLSMLLGCGGDGPINDTPTPATGGTGTVTGSITLSLTKLSDNSPTTSVSVDSPAKLTAFAVDSAGRRISLRTMSFSATSDLSFDPASTTALTDENGRATITVIAGSKVGATTIKAELTDLSGTTISGTISLSVDKSDVSTGIPDQDSISMAASILNIDGWSVDGATSDITVRLADHYNNLVPDGTVVNFRTSGGSIQPSCATTNGACTVQFTSQAPRPANGRAVVWAYVSGEESFTDLNGNGQFDPGIDTFTDMPEPFLDANENGVWDANEEFIDTNADGLYSPGDGIFNGILRNASISGPKTIHVRGSLTIVLSGSDAVIKIDGSTSPPARNITACTTAAPFTAGSVSFDVVVADVNGNVMPAGTTISFRTTNGTILTTATYVVPNTSTTSPPTYPVTIQSDAGQAGTRAPFTCGNTIPSGIFTVTVTTPKQISTYQYMTIND